MNKYLRNSFKYIVYSVIAVTNNANKLRLYHSKQTFPEQHVKTTFFLFAVVLILLYCFEKFMSR